MILHLYMRVRLPSCGEPVQSPMFCRPRQVYYELFRVHTMKKSLIAWKPANHMLRNSTKVQTTTISCMIHQSQITIHLHLHKLPRIDISTLLLDKLSDVTQKSRVTINFIPELAFSNTWQHPRHRNRKWWARRNWRKAQIRSQCKMD